MNFPDFDLVVTSPSSSGPFQATIKPSGNLGFVHAFVLSLSMMVISELGDKSFFPATIMAMRHSRVTVFTGAMSALTFMTVLSALCGYAIRIIPRVFTYYISTALFAMFGFKMLYDGLTMSSGEGTQEFAVQASLCNRSPDEDLERQTLVIPTESDTGCKLPSKAKRILFSVFSPVYLQVLIMTFLAEWGDRSQLSTVALAATEDISGVCVGGVLGHSLCTGLAVVGGRIIAQKISVRTVTICGGVVFLLFAVTSLFMSPN